MTGSDWHPNDAQRAAVAHGAGPLRLLAGAGSGKTTTLVHRIRSLVEQGLCRAGQVLMLTFTNKAAAEMRAKVEAILGGAEQPRVETYHAFAWSLVREYAPYLGMPSDARLLTQGPARLFARLRFDRLGVSRLDLTRLGAAVADTLDFFSWHRHEGTCRLPADDLLGRLSEADDPDLVRELLSAYTAYRTLLREHGAADFDDVIALAVELLEQHEPVRRQVQERYPFLLVDEYQDTDFLQGRLIRALAGERANVTIVGDPDQTIYSFRGAAMTNILHFDREYPGVTSVYMVTNYRSTPEIVAAANAVIGHNSRRKAEELVSGRAPGARPLLVTAPDWGTEARWLAAEAKRLHEEEGIAYGDMAVLVRKNRLKLPLWAALTEAGVPAQMVGGVDLLSDEETGRFLAYLQALADPADDTSVSVALGMARYGLTDRDLAALARGRRKGETLLEAAARACGRGAGPGTPDPRLTRFLDEFWPLYHAQFAEGAQAAIRGALRLHRGALSPQAQAGCEQLLPLSEGLLAHPELFQGLSAGATGGLALFCRYLEALREAGDEAEAAEWEPEGDAVRLMTVHAVKGLEFAVVFLPRLTKSDFSPKENEKWESAFPLAWHHDQEFAANLALMKQEEERRLFYVALTRARDRLFLSWAPQDPARKRPLAPSAFLAEVEAACDGVTLEPVARPEAGPAADVAAAVAPLLSDRPAPPLGAGRPDGAAPAWAPAPPEMLSFSHLHTYQLCPYRFYLQFILRLPGRPSTAADEGVRVHAAIEQFGALQASGAQVGFEHLAALVAAPALPEAGDDDRHEPEGDAAQAGGREGALRSFWESEYAAIPPLASEQEFHIRVGGAVIRGFIDRIHRRLDGEVEVVDFKTYNRLLSEAEVKDGLQLPLYIHACHEALGRPEVRQGALFFLKHGAVVRVRYTDEEMAEQLRRTADLVGRIQAGEWDPTPGPVCRWCQYREICPVAQ